MCLCLRGSKDRHGKWCCCSTWFGMHFSGLASCALLVFYFILMIRSSEHDEFNWLILVWISIIGFPRVIFWIIHCSDSIIHRRNYAFALVATTCIELLIFVVNQFIIFVHDDSYCERTYAVTYMMIQWNISCNWAVTLFELGTAMCITFYFYGCIGAMDHYYMGFLNPRLEAKEIQRMRLQKTETSGKTGKNSYVDCDEVNFNNKKGQQQQVIMMDPSKQPLIMQQN